MGNYGLYHQIWRFPADFRFNQMTGQQEFTQFLPKESILTHKQHT